MTTTADRIRIVWEWCCAAYLQYGNRKLSFPRNTDPTKTYQWRYLQTLEHKFREWEFDDTLAKAFIVIGVKYAVRHKLMNKGLAIFHQSNLLKVFHDQLCKAAAFAKSTIGIVANTKSWLDSQAAGQPLLDVLLMRESIGSYSNIVKWYQAGRLPVEYLALSRSCGLAMARLLKEAPGEREVLPDNLCLFTTRTSILQEVDTKFKLRNTLQEDWRLPCN